MKKLLLVAVAFAAYAAFRRIGEHHAPSVAKALPPVDELAHRLQDAWADHHTVA